MIAARISACLTDISCWMKDHHLQLNLAKTKLLVVPSNPSFHHNFTIQLGTSTITPSKTARNFGVMIDDQLTQTTLLKLPSPADLLYSTSGRSDPFFPSMLHNSLFKLLFCPGWTIAMLSWQVFQTVLYNCTTCIHNAALRLLFNEPKRMHVTPLFINLHWLQIAACIKFKALMFAYFIVPSQRGTKSLSQTFKLNVPSWWNDLPNSIQGAASLAIFKNRLKTHLFHLYLTL